MSWAGVVLSYPVLSKRANNAKTKISDPARCSDSGGARGVGGLTCGLELELQLSDRIDITFKEMNVPLNQKVHNDATRHSASNDPSTIKVFKE
jgi:hypothetical protein